MVSQVKYVAITLIVLLVCSCGYGTVKIINETTYELLIYIDGDNQGTIEALSEGLITTTTGKHFIEAYAYDAGGMYLWSVDVFVPPVITYVVTVKEP